MKFFPLIAFFTLSATSAAATDCCTITTSETCPAGKVNVNMDTMVKDAMVETCCRVMIRFSDNNADLTNLNLASLGACTAPSTEVEAITEPEETEPEEQAPAQPSRALQ